MSLEQNFEDCKRTRSQLADICDELRKENEYLQRQLSACKDIDKELGVLRETVERLRAQNRDAVREIRRLVQAKVDLQSEAKRLRAEVAEAKENWCPKAERDNALQEVERLRAEFERIANYRAGRNGRGWIDMQNVARQALETT